MRCGLKNALAPSFPTPLKRLKEYDTKDMSLPHTNMFGLFLTRRNFIIFHSGTSIGNNKGAVM
jgi:hypothetical protein